MNSHDPAAFSGLAIILIFINTADFLPERGLLHLRGMYCNVGGEGQLK
jgi:hypothetical protein